jgi:hypothetical protein
MVGRKGIQAQMQMQLNQRLLKHIEEVCDYNLKWP